MSSVTRRRHGELTEEPAELTTSAAEETAAEESYQKSPCEVVEGRHSSEDRKHVGSREPALPFVEVVFYALCIVGIMFKSCVLAVYTKSKDHIADFGEYNLSPGWRIFGGRYQDVSDFEWSYAKSSNLSIPFLGATVVFVIHGLIVDAYVPKVKAYTGLAFSLICFTIFSGWKVIFMILLHVIVTFMASRTRRAVIVWVVLLFQIATLNFNFFIGYQRQFFTEEEDLLTYIFACSICLLRLLSFACDYCQNCDKQAVQRWSFVDVIVYTFYLHTFIGGPVLTYDKFRTQYYQEPRPFSKQELKKIFMELLRYVFWMVFIDTMLHFLYFPSFKQRTHLLMFLPSWAVGGVALNQLIFFQLKYMVMYGIPRVGGLFDRLDIPLPPICVLGTYLFQDFWRYFDRGLHRLLMTCIYIPLGGSKYGIIRQLLASMLCFGFVFYWHGADMYLFYWALFNWMGVTMETMVQLMIKKLSIDTFMRNQLPCAVYRWMVGVLRVPPYICLATCNLVFLSGTRTAYVFFDRLILSDGYSTFRFLTAMSCNTLMQLFHAITNVLPNVWVGRFHVS